MWPARANAKLTEVTDGKVFHWKRPTGDRRKPADVVGGHGAVDGSMASEMEGTGGCGRRTLGLLMGGWPEDVAGLTTTASLPIFEPCNG